MSDAQAPEVGTISWADLTVADAPAVRDFYRAVVGWSASGFDMGGYEDFVMVTPASQAPIAGICHARGANAGLPAQWLVYITVEDVEASAATCETLGGKVLVAPRELGTQGRFCVIQDPAGAVAALFQAANGEETAS